ncbi:hypothetical protein SCHIN_v1c07990 [Spiroplasma chinense]|uniref:MurR/RpiR family transcriptional regulator n=1 Tax=Spiroplasma chinense TaxID=216932 RepID=A0A5B9Y4I2_9MOLU|nr:SIS domain-containing protein [Spiroplasma chinense]QEH61994.1 hypothetical protein SCHIN_v1c07990 [Spiroplasma chinense]
MKKEFSEVEKKVNELNKKDIDFLNFCKNNIDLILDSNLKDISQQYGCGMSFIYNFFKKINISSINEFRVFLHTSKYKNEENEQINIMKSTIEDVIDNNNVMFENQLDKIDDLLKEIFEQRKTLYICGLGYSGIAAYDFFALKFLINFNNWHFVNESKDDYSFNFNTVKENSLFVVFSLSGRSKKNMILINKIRELNKNCKIIMITGNSDYNKDGVDDAIITSNLMKMNDIYTKLVIVSPSTDFLFFNNFFKTRALHKYKDLFFESSKFNDEYSWWIKPKKIKNLKF